MVGVYVIMQTLVLLLGIIDLGLFARAILSWFTMGEQTRLGGFLFVLTEPVIWPLRRLFDRLGWFQGFPLDMPFICTSVLLTFVIVSITTWLGL